MKTSTHKKKTAKAKESCQAYFYYHPVIHMIHLFCIFFTTYTIVSDLGAFIFKWSAMNKLAYYSFAVVMTMIFFFVIRPGMKKRLQTSR